MHAQVPKSQKEDVASLSAPTEDASLQVHRCTGVYADHCRKCGAYRVLCITECICNPICMDCRFGVLPKAEAYPVTMEMLKRGFFDVAA